MKFDGRRFELRFLETHDVAMLTHRKSCWAEFYTRKELVERGDEIIERFKKKLIRGRYW